MAGGATTNDEEEPGLPPAAAAAVADPSPSSRTSRQQRLERRARLREEEKEATTKATVGDPRLLRPSTSTAAAATTTGTAATRRPSRRGSAVTAMGPIPTASTTAGAATAEHPPLSLRKRGQKRRDVGDHNECNSEGAAPSTAAASTAEATAALSLLKSPPRRASVKKPKASVAPPAASSSSFAAAPGETDGALEPQTLLRPNEEGVGRVDSTTSTSAPRTRSGGYNLRATTLALSVRSNAPKTTGNATFITPGTPAEAPLARHLDFERHGEGVGVAAASASDGKPPADSVDDNDLVLPPGVVNVFGRRSVSCHCPADRCYLTDTAVGFSHIANYGDENGQILKRQEVQQLDALRSLLPALARHPHSSQDSSEESLWSAGTNPDAFPPNVHDASHGFEGSVLTGSHPRSSGAGGGARQLNLEGSFGAGNGGEGGGIPPAQWTRTSALLRQPYLSPRMRAILVHWLVEVGQEYKVSEPAFHLAVSMLDHLLLKGPTAEELAAHDNGDEHYGEDAEDRWFLITRSNFQAVGWYVRPPDNIAARGGSRFTRATGQ